MNMKKISIAATIAFATLSTSTAFAHNNHQKKFVAMDDSLSTQLCMLAAKGKKFQFANLLRSSNLNKRFVAEQLKCNDSELPNFVVQHNDKARAILSLLPLDNTHITIRDIARVEHHRQK